MRGHFDYELFDFPPFGRNFGDHFGFGNCGQGYGHFRGPVGPFDQDRPGCPYGPPRPHRGPPGFGPPHDRHHEFGPGHHGPRPGHRHGPNRGPECDYSPDRHEHGTRPCGRPGQSPDRHHGYRPDHSPERHHGPHHGPGPWGRRNHSPGGNNGPHHGPRPCGGPDHTPDRGHGPCHEHRPFGPDVCSEPHKSRGPCRGPKCGRSRSPEYNFGSMGNLCPRFHHGPDSHSHWFRPHHGPEGFGPWKQCFGPKRHGPYDRPGGSGGRQDCCKNGPCCSRGLPKEKRCDEGKKNRPCGDKDRDENVTGDTVLVQRIVVEKALRPNSV